MKFWCTLLALMIIQGTVFSQTKKDQKLIAGKNANVQGAARYYLKKRINPVPGFSSHYALLFSGSNKYSKKDTLLALKIINRLYEFDEVKFFRLMRIRLEWVFRQRLLKSHLDSVKSLVKNNNDYAYYAFMMAIYYGDSLTAKLAYRNGYVRARIDGTEVTDWEKMRQVQWGHMRMLEIISHYKAPPFKNMPVKDSTFKYYKKAIELDRKQFYYLKEFLICLLKLGEDTEIQKIITSKLNQYSTDENIWLEKFLDMSYRREKITQNDKEWYDLD